MHTCILHSGSRCWPHSQWPSLSAFGAFFGAFLDGQCAQRASTVGGDLLFHSSQMFAFLSNSK